MLLTSRTPINTANDDDQDGNPAGGAVAGIGISIRWQSGPLGRGADARPQNGAFVEDVLFAALQRLYYYQGSKYSCRENAVAITHIEEAMMWLNARMAERERRQVQGTHQV